jgi:hypothetical protein
MSDDAIREFSVGDLYEALEAKRLASDLTWQEVADQIWDMSKDLNDRRHDHPISPSTLKGMRQRDATSCQHALFMLRWLDRSPESFLLGADDSQGTPLPDVRSDRRLRWNLVTLYEAMNVQRLDRGLTWPVLAKILRCTPSQLTGLRTAKFATGMKLAMRIAQWLDRPAADFVYAARW